MTTQSFADYAAQKDAQNTIELNIRKYCLMLCDALQNFKSRNHGKVGGYDAPEYKFSLRLLVSITKSGWKPNRSRSIHAFVDKKVMFSNPPVSKHPQNTFVTMSCGWNP